ncbi:MAG TPA: hypothetical protein VGL24_07435 [Chthoniobacterales bacterium]|jgi:hypothetical protein
MRRNDLNDGSIKTLLILALLAANIVLAFPPGRPSASSPSGEAPVVSPKTRLTSVTEMQGKLWADLPGTARESRTIPYSLQPYR